jgi:drug/metabolite transporter (DMT)-like permease
MLLGGNGLVCWAEQWVPSGLAALLIASVPLWMALFEGLLGGARPRPQVLVGLLLGFLGVALLVGDGASAGGDGRVLAGAAGLVAAAALWAAGSLLSRRVALPPSPILATGMEMIAGGAALLLVGSVVGEWGRLDPGAVSLRSALSFVYLAVAGSIVAFTAYVWLLRVSTPSKAATYAYVNPVVAVLLGWAFAGERLDARILVGAAVILGAVVLITTSRPPTPRD